MNPAQSQKRLDSIVSPFLTIFLFMSLLYRFNPIIFLNPGFPILDKDDLRFSDKFVLTSFSGEYYYKRNSFYAQFQFEDTTQILPSNGPLTITGFTGFHDLIELSNKREAEQTLQQKYQEYIENEGALPYRMTDIPLAGFASKADRYLLWCEHFSHEPGFDAEEVTGCFYWAVYDRYLSRTRVIMWPIRGWGRQYSLELFGQVIESVEDEMMSKIYH